MSKKTQLAQKKEVAGVLRRFIENRAEDAPKLMCKDLAAEISRQYGKMISWPTLREIAEVWEVDYKKVVSNSHSTPVSALHNRVTELMTELSKVSKRVAVLEEALA